MLKNITLSAPAADIAAARAAATARGTALNEGFRQFLISLAGRPDAGQRFLDFTKTLDHVQFGGKYTRDELNER